MQKLDAKIIRNLFDDLSRNATHQCNVAVEVVQETGSTNADLMKRARELTAPLLLLAENQTAGRGRAGRTWLSTPGGVLTFSLAWFFPKTAQELSGLSLVVGLAIAEKLREIGVPVQLKWPNDILKDGKKLGGILIESQAMPEQGRWAIIGVGLNLIVSQALEASIGQTVADAPWLAKMERNLLVAHLLQALSKALQVFDEYGFEVFVERWNRIHAHQDTAVHILDQGQEQQRGLALGVDANGALILQTADGIVTIHSGDVSLRALP
jgi:BirA family biotin operon repressor/biotin-[acetyl-CoA-carboxylase] ligase